MDIQRTVKAQKRFYQTGQTHPIDTRRAALRRLYRGIKRYEEDILKALQDDLGKSPSEGYMTEVGLVLEEIRVAEKNVEKWARPQWRRPSVAQIPARCQERPEPLGVVLIMSPWNYPFMLTLTPLVGALAAGNCAVLKPSNQAPQTSQIIATLMAELFPPQYVTVVQGGREENQALLEQPFDYIFFTGGDKVGRLVAEKAGQQLIPVTLELGGKSPCIVDESADLNTAARRIVFGKFINCGQTCVAPDYILVQDTVKAEFLSCLRYWLRREYGDNPLTNPNYPRIVNSRHYHRLMGLMEGEKVIEGGIGNEKTLKIAPTILDNITGDSPVMQEEIFGPILPVLTFHQIWEAREFIAERDHPLALYLFSNDPTIQKQMMEGLTFGGGTINDTLVHMATPYMAFGGVGASGYGRYHGRFSFDTFSHKKSTMQRYTRLDIPLWYRPHSPFQNWLLRKLLK